MLHEDRDNLKNWDIRTVQPEILQDIKTIAVDMELPAEERMKEFVRQIKNPYFFRCGKLIVQIEYSDSDRTIHDCIMEYIESQIK